MCSCKTDIKYYATRVVFRYSFSVMGEFATLLDNVHRNPLNHITMSN